MIRIDIGAARKKVASRTLSVDALEQSVYDLLDELETTRGELADRHAECDAMCSMMTQVSRERDEALERLMHYEEMVPILEETLRIVAAERDALRLVVEVAS